MNELIVGNHTLHTLNSREVAEMVGKEHKNLLRDIHTYISYMKGGQLKIEPSDFFIESTYQNEQNKTMPCFLITRKGCDHLAHKMTGQKDTLFTAMYITRFYAME